MIKLHGMKNINILFGMFDWEFREFLHSLLNVLDFNIYDLLQSEGKTDVRQKHVIFHFSCCSCL
jgi:hypothetical protein